MKTFKIPVEWKCFGVVEIEASSIEEAVKMAKDENVPLPEGNYMDSSWEVNNDKVLIDELNKN